jgi:flagellar basal body-associated protein FliL
LGPFENSKGEITISELTPDDEPVFTYNSFSGTNGSKLKEAIKKSEKKIKEAIINTFKQMKEDELKK